MSWKLERDSLIAQTLAFVQSVTGGREDIDRPEAALAQSPQPETSDRAFAAQPSRMALPKAETIQKPASPPPATTTPAGPFAPGEMAAEIRARVESFRAHQARFNREREEYFASTLAKLRAAIKDGRSPRQPD